MGNMVPILAALLIGGWQGGLAGSIGMGLYLSLIHIFSGRAALNINDAVQRPGAVR